ncbi:hypothetical protein PROPEN_00661 [Proteus penneri ATCC 35198]|nr:hypothetical protein PROPEN_00661 [Proteus penneri ATCC 35198]
MKKECNSSEDARQLLIGYLQSEVSIIWGDYSMSFEVFEKLESKVQQAIDTITLLQMEIEELKEKNDALSQEVQEAKRITRSPCS